MAEKFKNYFGSHRSTILSALASDREESDNYCDVTLHVDEDQFLAHKCILGKISPFFNKMFKTEMKEKYDSFANIKGLNSTTMQMILSFIYKAAIKITEENIMDLLAASNYLQMDELKSCCVEYLADGINASNCLRLRVKGQMFNCEQLTENADLLVSETFHELIKTDEFKQLDFDSIVDILNKQDQKLGGNKDIFHGVINWIKFDVETRKENFTDLLKIVKLYLFPTDFLENVVAKEKLIDQFPECLKYFQQELLKRFRLTVCKRKACDDLQMTSREIVKRNQFVMTSGQSIAIFDVPSRTWLDEITVPRGTTGACFVAINSLLYMIGGRAAPRSICSLDLNSDLRDWEKLGQTLDKRVSLFDFKKAVFHKGMIVITNGTYSDNSIEMFEPISKSQTKIKWSSQVSGIVKYRDCLYCYQENGTFQKVDSKEPVADLGVEACDSASVEHNNELYVAGYCKEYCKEYKPKPAPQPASLVEETINKKKISGFCREMKSTPAPPFKKATRSTDQSSIPLSISPVGTAQDSNKAGFGSGFQLPNNAGLGFSGFASSSTSSQGLIEHTGPVGYQSSNKVEIDLLL